MLSVIFCVNKSNPHLGAAIQSVLNQTYRNFELLIAANGCPDSLISELEEITKGDPRVRMWRLSLGQHAFSLNFLIEQAQGEWLVRMDSDDLCEPQRFARLKEQIADGDYDVIGSWATLINERDEEIGAARPQTSTTSIRRGFLTRSQILHPSVAMRKTFWLDMRGYIGGFATEDFDLWLRSLAQRAKITNIPEPLIRYRIHSGQLSRSRRSYAETAAYWYRELIVRPSLYNLAGWVISSVKALVMPIKNRWKIAHPVALTQPRAAQHNPGVEPEAPLS